MRKSKSTILVAFLTAVAINAIAFDEGAIAEEPIYVDVDEAGVPSFSNTQGPEAKEIELREPSTYSSPIKKQQNSPNLPAWKQDEDDERLEPSAVYTAKITSPGQDATLRANAGNLTVEVQLSPALQSDHRGELLLDGQPVSTINATGPVNLTNLDRGTHNLQVRIYNTKGKVIHESNSVVVNILRASRLH